MKKSTIVFFATIAFLLVTNISQAQLFFRIGTGYGFGNQKLLLDQSYTVNSIENRYASFGGNFGFLIGAGMQLNEHMDLEADLGYQNGRSVVVDNVIYNKKFTGRLLYLNPSISFKTSVDEKVVPYAKVGILAGLSVVNVTVNTETNKFRGGIPVGMNEALGLNFNTSDHLKFYVELYHQSMIYSPKKRKDSNGDVVKFKDTVGVPTPSDIELKHHFFSFGAIGLNLGVKFALDN